MILVTGGTGFIGSGLLLELVKKGLSVRAAVRSNNTSLPESIELSLIEDISEKTNWCAALKDVDAVFHCAARVHVMKDGADNVLDEYRKINVRGTLNLARQAANAGVNRFIFLSSIKVNGENTKAAHPFTANDFPAPLDAYAFSKFEAEQGLREIEKQTGMEVVIVRPPLVYGPGVGGNFAILMRCITYGIPLPFGKVNNLRSLVGRNNLVDLLLTCLNHPAAKGQTFLVSDGEDISTSELLLRVGSAMKRRVYLIPMPESIMRAAATICGRRKAAERLYGSLQVDIKNTCHLLGWRPPFNMEGELEKAAKGFRKF